MCGKLKKLSAFIPFCFPCEAPQASNKAVAAYPNYGDVGTDPQYSRVSKISVDSFESSCTSSEECYENTNGYVMVSPGQ